MANENAGRSGLAGCLVVLMLLAALIAFAVWAWGQGGGGSPSYWH